MSIDSDVADEGNPRQPRAATVDPTRVSAPLGATRSRAVSAPVRWQQRFSRLVTTMDITVITVTVTAIVLSGLGGPPASDRAGIVTGAVSAGLLVTALMLCRAWEYRILGYGATEFVRLGRAVTLSSVALGLAGLLLKVDSVRFWVFLLIPLTGGLCLVARFVLRKWLHRQRRAGRCALPVLAVGSEDAVSDLIRRTRRDPFFGWKVTAACTPTGAGTRSSGDIDGVEVIGDLDSIPRLAAAHDHRVVAVCRAPGWGPSRLHRLAWQLEGTNAELAVDPGLMEIAGPRMHIAPVDGLPLLLLSHPRFTGTARLLKATVDRCVAALLLLLTLPLFLAVSIAVRLGDGGPVFFRQERVGLHGHGFRMIKFRSMNPDAEVRLGDLTKSNDGAGPLFKMYADPRVTRVGRLLRRYSLDELPQLLNVLNGTMSLVGPRPPLPSEVQTFADDARRRLLVRPGMTGLWQVSGRSSLTWEESVRLDLRYVENWSLALDLVIVWKTFGAVVFGRGAY